MFIKFKRQLLRWQSQRLNKRGDSLWRQANLSGAETCFREAIAKNRSFAPAYSNLGALLMDLHRYEEGIDLLLHAAKLAPDHPGILVNLGNAYGRGNRSDLAVEQYLKALQIEPENAPALANVARALMDNCQWDEIDQYIMPLVERIRRHDPIALAAMTPFAMFFLPTSRAEQLAVARYHTKVCLDISPSKFMGRFGKRRIEGSRIRIGYLSSDFHDHPTVHLSLRLYGLHDRKRFEVYAYSLGYPDDSHYRRRIQADCDKFTDVHSLDSEEIAQRIADDHIDILVDLKGLTGGGRPEILAFRPAPIQVNYLGYPGTTGAPFEDYIIADEIVIPEAHANNYSETVMRLEHCYQVTDNQQFIASERTDRSAHQLPNDAFVYCSFNTSAKLDRRTFNCWMQILLAVPDSVLWLLAPPTVAQDRLAAAAKFAGIDPRRIVFAPVLRKPDHLARLRLADLALDPLVCNSHTTGTDALWVGLPMLTMIGDTFASRVGASLLTAVRLHELITTDEKHYVELAVELARNRGRLRELRSKLADSAELPLFQTEQYVKDLERAFLDMVQRHNQMVGQA